MKYSTCSLAENEKRQNKNNRIVSNVIVVVTLVLLFIIIMNTFVFMTIEVDGSSMFPTLYDGDVIKVNKLISPEKGDIVIIKKYSAEKGKEILVVKRVIAMEGDTVKIENDTLYLNGEVLVEDYIKDDPTTPHVDESKTPVWTDGDYLEYTLNDGEIFYLGDNRWNSIDSRQDGCCKESAVVGVLENWAYKMKGFFKFFH